MKIRTGFVSNSSSTSFCITGIIKRKSEFTENDLETYYNDSIIDVCSTDEAGDLCAIGLEITKMFEHETLNEFKHRVMYALSNIGLNVPVEEIGIHYGGWYDG
jgi:hypothetical protein